MHEVKEVLTKEDKKRGREEPKKGVVEPKRSMRCTRKRKGDNDEDWVPPNEQHAKKHTRQGRETYKTQGEAHREVVKATPKTTKKAIVEGNFVELFTTRKNSTIIKKVLGDTDAEDLPLSTFIEKKRGEKGARLREEPIKLNEIKSGGDKDLISKVTPPNLKDTKQLKQSTEKGGERKSNKGMPTINEQELIRAATPSKERGKSATKQANSTKTVSEAHTSSLVTKQPIHSAHNKASIIAALATKDNVEMPPELFTISEKTTLKWDLLEVHLSKIQVFFAFLRIFGMD